MTTPEGAIPSDYGAVRSEAETLNINPNSPPPPKTLVYSPDVQILIARGNKQYDVSADVVAFSIRRIENGVSSAVFRLSNKSLPGEPKKLRYSRLFERMDRVVIRLKRVEWVQVFSGYLDQVPYVQLYPGTVNFRASCTLKRLMHTWWDPGLRAAQEIFNQPGVSQQETINGEQQLDRGLGSLLRRLLVNVGGWDSQNIHIQRFPVGFFLFMNEELRKTSEGTQIAAQNFRELLLGAGDTSLGPGRSAGLQSGVTMGNYTLTAPERMAEVIRAVDEMGMGPDTTDLAASQGLGTVAASGKDQRDQEFFRGQQEVGRNWSDAALKSDAAIHAFMTIMVESNWVMYANAAVPESLTYPHEALSTDGTSVGLYQQQNFGEWGNVSQRMNVKASTQMFLQHLARLDWRNMDRGAACQAVQRSAKPWKYAEFEAAAIEAVRALRSGTGTAQGAGGPNNTSPTNPLAGAGLGATPVGTVTPPITAGPLRTGGLPSTPTTNGTPTVMAAATQVGKPAYDTGGALSCAIAQIGKPYVWGQRGPASFDCSGLMQFCYRSIGLEIGSTTYEQAGRLQRIPPSNLVPGDIIQPNPDHTVMYMGPGQIIHAPQQGDVVRAASIYFDLNSAVCYRVPGAEFGGTIPAPFDIARAISTSNAIAGTSTTGLNGTTGTGQTEPIARNLFTYQFMPGQFTNYISSLFGNEPGTEEKAFINDEPLIQTVISFAEAGLRNFQSAPNGDFIAYYPDYFGLDGKDAIWTLEDIEMKNVQIDLNDDALTTHVYVAGSASPVASGGDGVPGWLASQGVATVENRWLYERMTLAAPRTVGDGLIDGNEIMSRYGVRPLVKSMSSVMRGPMEFLLAVQTFMTKWAEQYSTQIETTFMPEVFPGMRLHLKDHGLQVYVREVTHSGDFESGFTTSMTIMAPSNPTIRKMAESIFKATYEQIASGMALMSQQSEVVES